MRLFCFLVLLLYSCGYTLAQQDIALKPGADTAAINRLLRTADTMHVLDSSIASFDRALRMSIAANYADGAFIALITAGIKSKEKENYAQAQRYYTKALYWAAKCTQKDAVAWCYNNIGDICLFEGDYARASESFYIALKELQKTPPGPTHTAANIYNNLGVVNIRLGQKSKALGYFNQAEKISQHGNLDYQLAETYINKGEYYTAEHMPDSAEKYFANVRRIGAKMGKADLLAVADGKTGKMLVEMGEYEQAIPYLQNAISLSNGRFYDIVTDASFSLGNAWFRLHRYKEAEVILRSSLTATMAHNTRDRYIEGYSKLIDVYKATGAYEKAMQYMDTVAVLKERLISAEKARAINLMEIKYATAEKDKQIAQQKAKLITKNFWIAICLLFPVFILAITYSKVRNKQQLQAEQIKTLQREGTIGILKGVVQGEENERGRIARELHDGIGGMLSAAMMRLMAIRHDNEKIVEVAAYHEAMDIMEEIGDEIRKMSHNLTPEVLLKQDLHDALRNYCVSLQNNELLIDFQSYGDFGSMAQDFKLNVYRIIQELLKNIVQHANASSALVQLLVHENTLTITVEDNGVGFDTAKKNDGIGLQNLQRRVSSLDGHFTVESAIGKGATFYIEFDIKHEQI